METVWTVAGHTVLDTPQVLFQTESLFCGAKINITLQTKHIPIKIKERKTENVIKKKSTTMAIVRSREILMKSQQEGNQALLCNEVQST